jgi:hypothetical protein
VNYVIIIVNCVACLQRHEVIFASQDKLISKVHFKTIYMKPISTKENLIIGLIAGILGIIGHFTCSDFCRNIIIRYCLLVETVEPL